ncbi:cell division protein FtsZ [Brucella sp. 10RB9215]|uniref:cell division protein FtsZ n=1 Tax=unclassified Brucella TaxID=2632610 RepID=UPI00084F9119|nr:MULTISPECIES: cell division protein FtsZ [unclassified Brucella]APY14494.1 cell division protein FtsZ [Brucella sp. 09RB8910]MRN45606.1 cell division protein FtsZ [Brucella sp. 10RB9212]MRN51319.1 cell division protein FtsZ [Brucella sp. 10RB9214]MRN66070.1 cell division protein FtsZ [Brucella sp. 10RB9213]MRN78646.1 cell division protein FtsZ [Brucella sp. 10RB9210]
MTINLQKPDITELKPRITVFGVGGGGGNAVNNMINAGLRGVDFVVANTDAQALTMSKSDRIIQLGAAVTEGLGAGSQPEVGRAAAEECIDEIVDHLNGTHMCFVTAGMGGGTGTGAAPVVARAARERGILTVGVVTKPFHFEGARRMKTADLGIEELQKNVDTLIVIPNQNLFRIANDKTTFADAFAMADQVLYSGVACITDLMVKEGLINLDFADVRSVMREMGKAMMGTGEASGEGRAMAAAEAAIANPLLDETSMRGAKGLLISITGGRDMTLFEVDEAATRIREEVDPEANIILGATFDEGLEGVIRVSVVATGIDKQQGDAAPAPLEFRQPVKPTAAQAKPMAPHGALRPPVAEQPRQADPVAQVIQAAEAEMPVAPAAPAASAEPEFRPQSRIFQAPAPEAFERAPVARAPMQQAQAMHAPQPQQYQQPQMHEQPVREPRPAPRMPAVSDFPPVAQAEINARRAPQQPVQEEPRGPMGLLKRLTHGLSRREEEQPAARLEPAQHREPGMRPAEPRRPMQQDSSIYAPRRGQLDDQGRPQPRAASEEDQLEIPAFLRRQSN